MSPPLRLALAALAALSLAGSTASAQPAAGADFMTQNAKAEGVQSLPSGVQYKVLKSGPEAGAHPRIHDIVQVNYEGALLDGAVFDSSAKTGGPRMFQLSTLVPGWIDALQAMRPGDQWTIWVPPARGYGARQVGPIPPNSVLVFKLELVSVTPGS